MVLVRIGMAMLPLLVTTLPAQTTASGITWERDFEAALAAAKASSRPIMVAFLLKGEPANEEIIRNHFHDADIVRESRRFVCVAACMEAHGDGACPAFPGIACAEHHRAESQARAALLASNIVSAPQFFFLRPDGKTVLLRHVWALPPQSLLQKMKSAQGYADPATAGEAVAAERARVDLLLKDAAADHAERRRQALDTLAALDDPRVMEFLICQTGPGVDSTKRNEAIRAMGVAGNAKALDCLHRLLAQNDVQTRLYAATSLAKVAMKESTAPLFAVFKKETRDRLRSHLARAILACTDDAETRATTVLALIKGTSQLEAVTGLWLAAILPAAPELDRAIQKAASSNNGQIRAAAYYAIGSRKIAAARDAMKKRKSTERGAARNNLEWALSELEGTPFQGDDPDTLVRELLPDAELY